MAEQTTEGPSTAVFLKLQQAWQDFDAAADEERWTYLNAVVSACMAEANIFVRDMKRSRRIPVHEEGVELPWVLAAETPRARRRPSRLRAAKPVSVPPVPDESRKAVMSTGSGPSPGHVRRVVLHAPPAGTGESRARAERRPAARLPRTPRPSQRMARALTAGDRNGASNVSKAPKGGDRVTPNTGR